MNRLFGAAAGGCVPAYQPNQKLWPARVLLCLALSHLLAVAASAAVTRIEIKSVEPYAGGREFAGVGAYQRSIGRVYFSLAPALPVNQQIVDLDLAPRDSDGRVSFAADIEILAPVDLSRARGTLLYDVNNRGNRAALGLFNTGADEFLMRNGYIVVWSGWIAEVLPGAGRLRLDAPLALKNGQPLTGFIRAEMAPDAPAERLSIAHWANQGSYEPVAESLPEATLTRRLREADPREAIERDQWQLEWRTVEVDGVRGTLPLVELVLAGGFQPGYLYELIYRARGSLVQGVGLAGIRDLVSFLRHDTTDKNPLRLADGSSAAKRAIGFGISQSGRCLRMLLYDDFNVDAQGRRVFDGMMPHVAGAGLGFFNHRFASPTRHNGQHDNHLFPVDMFPFAYGDQTDPLSRRSDGILRRPRESNSVPKIMHVQTSAEYWHRSGSLVHTDPLGKEDAEIPPEVRIYAIGGAQHGPGNGIPGEPSTGTLVHNPTDYRPILRALLTALDAWIADGVEPPPSRYPTIAAGELGGWRQIDSIRNRLLGVDYPTVIQRPELLFYGPQFLTKRIITEHPPVSRGEYKVLVPRHASDRNERGMLQLTSVAVPIATYTGWNLRDAKLGAEGELLGLTGGYIPLPRTRAERLKNSDPRESLQGRYGTFEKYLAEYEQAARKLIAERFLLAEELESQLEFARKQQSLFQW